MEDKKKVEVWEHIPTKRLFRSEEALVKFANGYDKEQAIKKAKQLDQQKYDEMINEPRLTSSTIDEFLVKMCALLDKIEPLKNGIKRSATFRISRISNFNPLVGNSHHAPIGYKHNWCGTGDKDGIPKGYPGWTGQFHFVPNDYSISWTDMHLHRGTSSSFGNRFPGFEVSNYDFYIWLYDFPLIHEKYRSRLLDKSKLEDEIKTSEQKDREYNTRRINYYLNHPETKVFRAKIDALTSELNRIKATKDVVEKSLASHNRECSEFYSSEIEKYNEGHTAELKRQLDFVNSQINKT